jgi:hypothetical protein
MKSKKSQKSQSLRAQSRGDALKQETKVLTTKDFERLWGENGPYSEVNLSEQTRILDDGVSRVFFTVEVVVNPFTIEYVRKHRKAFGGDEPVLQLIDHAQERGKYGYVASGGEVEVDMPGAREFAQRQARMSTEAIIRMHAFVLEAFGLKELKDTEEKEMRKAAEAFRASVKEKEDKKKEKEKGKRKEKASGLVWDEFAGVAVPEDEALSGMIGEMMLDDMERSKYVSYVLPLGKDFDFSKEGAMIFGRALMEASEAFNVKLDEGSAERDFALVCVYMDADTNPDMFIDMVTEICDSEIEGEMFGNDILVGEGEKPTPDIVQSFITSLREDDGGKKEKRQKMKNVKASGNARKTKKSTQTQSSKTSAKKGAASGAENSKRKTKKKSA